MCDYSLEMYRTRPAEEGADYETHRFQSGSIGFCAPDDKTMAVCMACDMGLTLTDLPEYVQKSAGVSAREDVTFVRLKTGPYFDGVRFENGQEVSLQQLGPGVKARVIDALTPQPQGQEHELVDAV